MPPDDQRDTLERLVRRLRNDRARLFRGRYRELDEALGMSAGYFSIGLNGNRPLRVDEVFRAIEIFGYHPGEYFDRLGSNRATFATMPHGFLESRRRKDRRTRPLRSCRELVTWVQEVHIHESGDDLRFELKAFTNLFGITGTHEEEQFGFTLLNILADRKPHSLTTQAARGLVQVLIQMAHTSCSHDKHGRGLDFLDLGFQLELRHPNFELRSRLFQVASHALEGIGFQHDATWCTFEALMLSLGTGAWSIIEQRFQECTQASDYVTGLLQHASDERKVSSLHIDRSFLNEPLGGARALDRLIRGKLRTAFTINRWAAFEERLATRGVLTRAFRAPFCPPPGSGPLKLAVHNELSGLGLSPTLKGYLEWLKGIDVIRSGSEEISFPTVAESEAVMRIGSSDTLHAHAASQHVLALAVSAHRIRIDGNHIGATSLFTAAFDLEAKIDSPRLRIHLYRLSMYLLRDIGAFDDSHRFAHRAVLLSLYASDRIGLSQSLYGLGVIESLAGRIEESIFLFSGCITLNTENSEVVAWSHHGIAYGHVRLENRDACETALLKAEEMEIHSLDGSIAFVRAILALQENRLNEADRFLEEAKRHFEVHASFIDRLLLGLYYTEYLVRSGRQFDALLEVKRLRTLAQSTTTPHNKIISAVFRKLTEIIGHGHISLTLVRQVCQKIESPWQVEARQPMGSP